METNVPKRKEPAKSLRIKVISMGNAEVGKVSTACCEGQDLRVPERRTHWVAEPSLNSLKLHLLCPLCSWGLVATRGKLS